MWYRQSKSKKSGFSLIEASIVLGVAGLVIAGIWSAASYVRAVVHREQTYQQVTSFVSELRNHYQNRAGIDLVPTAETTSRLISRGVVPAEMVRDPTANPLVADHALAGAGIDPYVPNANGSFEFLFAATDGTSAAAAAADPMMFRIVLRDLSVTNCVHVMTNLTGSKGSRGLVRLIYQGGNTTVFPISPEDALANCAGGWLSLSYQLRNR